MYCIVFLPWLVGTWIITSPVCVKKCFSLMLSGILFLVSVFSHVYWSLFSRRLGIPLWISGIQALFPPLYLPPLGYSALETVAALACWNSRLFLNSVWPQGSIWVTSPDTTVWKLPSWPWAQADVGLLFFFLFYLISY